MKHKSLRLTLTAMAFAMAVPVFASEESPTLESRLASLINVGQIDEARSLLETSPHEKADRLLLEGRIHKVEGRFALASDILEKALRLRPSDITIRRELAHTQYLTGQLGRAKFHLERLQRDDSSPILQKSYAGFLTKIYQERPLSFQANITLEPSTNLTRGTSATVLATAGADIAISEESRSQSGVGLQVGLGANYNAFASPNQRLSFGLEVRELRYSVKNDLGYTGTEISLRYDLRQGRTRLSLQPYMRLQDRNDGLRTTSQGLRLNSDFTLSKRSLLLAETSVEHQKFRDASQRNGWSASGNLGVKFQATKRTRMTFGIALESNKTNLPHHRYSGTGIFASIDSSLSTGLNLSAKLSLGQRDFSDEFPLLGYARHDEFAQVTVSAWSPRWHIVGFSPTVSCSHVINTSNVTLYDYQATGCQIGFSRNF
ncbi:porin family protein [Cognatishimia sp. 1_MG-2023]|uniref:porin family protein n=1 Tax=Cognatishimia sp. 1_MG-2023 TaxID=3062642 RepID=UPI0026E2BDB2|nr:porin family protein [Cognatishimia sp. 1_MG-2023]MDO6727776.1 porin family protein [Cognatishimia sp. 1_MG-2023]